MMSSTPSAAAAHAAPATAKSGGEVPSGLDEETRLLEDFAEVATASKAVLRRRPGGGLWLTTNMSQRNLPANGQRKFAYQTALSADGTPGAMSLPTELPDVQQTSVAPSGVRQLIVRGGNGDANSVALQLWAGGCLQWEVQVPKTVHGPLVNDGYFATGVAWSPDETTVAYTAEAPASEKTPAWGGPEAGKDQPGPRTWRGVAAAVEDWGELNTGKRDPQVFLLDLAQRRIIPAAAAAASGVASVGSATVGDATTTSEDSSSSVSPALPKGSSVGQPTWTPDGKGLLVVVWPNRSGNFPAMARKLGIVYCYNRTTQLYHLPVSRDAAGQLVPAASSTQLATTLGSVLSPSFSPDGTTLVFLSQQEALTTGVHSATARLCKLTWPKALEPGTPHELVVDVVQQPEPWKGAPAGAALFPGLYCVSIPDDAFAGPTTLLLTTQWLSQNALVAVDLTTGAVRPLTPVLPPLDPGAPLPSSTPSSPSSPTPASWSLQAVADGVVVAHRVAPDAPSRLHVAALPRDLSQLFSADQKQLPLQWQPLPGPADAPAGEPSSLPPSVAAGLADLGFAVMSVKPTVGPHTAPFESLVWYPKSKAAKGPLPTVLAPHGGPHTAILAGWYPPYAYLASLGYAVVCPNYRGSTGYGQAALQSLPGNIGRHDVDDCKAALQAAIDAGLSDPSRVLVVGGSHGGFLAGHLLGQFPDAFRAGVMRNPVCNLTLMIHVSDIPDWVYVEVYGCEEGIKRAGSLPTPEDLQRFFDKSPVAHVHNVKVPLMLMLGSKDRRVPPAEGHAYLAALRAAAAKAELETGQPRPETRLLVFPEDSHTLDKPQTEFEQWINVVWWLKRFAQPASALHSTTL